MTTVQLDAWLARRGFRFVRHTGHRHYEDPHGRRLTVATHGRPLGWRQRAAIERDIARMERQGRDEG